MSAEPATARADAAHAARSGLLQILQVLGQLLLLGVQFVISRLYGVAAYGLYMTSLGLLEVLVRGGYFGADKGMLRYIAAHRVAGERELERRALGTGLRLGAAVATVLAFGLALAAGRIAVAAGKPELAVLLPLMAPAIVFAVLMRILVEAMLAARAVRMNLYVRGLGEPAFLFVCVTLGAAAGAGIPRLGAAHLAAAAATCALALLAAARVFGGRHVLGALSAPRHPEFARFAAPVAGAEVLNAVLQRADVILLGLLVSREEAGVYAAAEFLARLIAAPRYAFDSIASPVLAEALTTRDRARLDYNLQLMTRFVTLISALALVLLLGLRRELLGLYGPLFVGGSTVFVVLALGHFVNGCLGLTPWVLTMSGRSRLMLWNNVGAAALNVTLNLLFIPRLGILGAALAALVSVLALQLACLAETWRLEAVHPFGAPLLRVLLAAALAFAVASLAGAWMPARLTAGLPGGPALRIVAVALAGGLAYLGVLLKIGLGEEEQGALERIGRALRLRR